MTRYTFGSSAADYVIQPPHLYDGQLKSAPNRSGSAWSAITGGAQYTDLIALEGTGPPSTDADGWINRFQGPDGVDRLWLQFNGTDRFFVLATDASFGPSGGGVNVDSPHFTGIPTAPTAASANNTTQLATTAFVQAVVGLLAAATQPLSSVLSALAGLTPAADKLPYFSGASTAALTTLTSAGRTLLAAADSAAQRVAIYGSSQYPEIVTLQSGGTYSRPNYPGRVNFQGTATPAIRTDGITTGGTNQAVQGLDSWTLRSLS